MHVTRLLAHIENSGNKLPAPSVLFIYLSFAVILLSGICAAIGVSAIHPISGEEIASVNLLSQFGLHQILTKTVSNFIEFAPVGSVLVATMGLGIAEKSGLIRDLLNISLKHTKGSLLTMSVVLAGVLSNIAVDVGYVVLIPLAAMVFIGAGRHPLAGIAAAFAGVSGGYSANLLIGPVDAILAGISTESATLVDPTYEVGVAGNYYFMAVSTILVTLVGTLVTELVVEKFLPESDSPKNTNVNHNLTAKQKHGLLLVGLITAVTAVLMIWGLVPENGFLRNPNDNEVTRSPAVLGIVTIVSVYAAICGVVYGRASGDLRNLEDATKAMESTLTTLASYLVLMFFAAQFVNYFAWSQLGTIFAINGAAAITTLDINTGVLLIIFIFFAAFINLFIGSASAKWALLGPVFVPMLLLAGISPEATQVAFRIGDSSTNIITPLMPYFGVIIAFAQKYKSDCGIGTIVAMMLPYSIAFLISWSALLIIWYTLGVPLGPGAHF